MTQTYKHGRKIEAPERSILLPLRLHDLPSPGALGCLFELLTPEPFFSSFDTKTRRICSSNYMGTICSATTVLVFTFAPYKFWHYLENSAKRPS